MKEEKKPSFLALVRVASESVVYLIDVTYNGQRYDGTFKININDLPLAKAPSDKDVNTTVKRPVTDGDVVAINVDDNFNITDVSVLRSAPATDNKDNFDNATDAIAALRLLRYRQYEEFRTLEGMGII